MADKAVKSLTPKQSYKLGRTEYWNLANKGKSMEQVWKKFTKNGVSHVWQREFINGWYGATMYDDAVSEAGRKAFSNDLVG